MNTKIIGIVILAVAIGGSSAYFLTKDDSLDTNSTSNKPIYQNEKIGLVINTVNPPKGIVELEEAYKIASTSGIGRTNLYVHWDYLKILSMHLQLNLSIDAIACDYLLVNNH